MKKKVLYIFLVVFSFFISCEKDNDITTIAADADTINQCFIYSQPDNRLIQKNYYSNDGYPKKIIGYDTTGGQNNIPGYSDEYDYNADGYITAQRSYDSKNRLRNQVLFYYTYDNSGELKSVEGINTNLNLELEYDETGRISSIYNDSYKTEFYYLYSDEGKIVEKIFNSVPDDKTFRIIKYTYNDSDRIVRLDFYHLPTDVNFYSSCFISYDNNGNVTSRTKTNLEDPDYSNETKWLYDNLNRITEIRVLNSEHYTRMIYSNNNFRVQETYSPWTFDIYLLHLPWEY